MSLGQRLLNLVWGLCGLAPSTDQAAPFAWLQREALPTCRVCGKWVTLRHWVSPHDEPFCLHHSVPASLCCGCGHVVRDPAHAPGVCEGCRPNIIESADQAQALLKRVQTDLRDMGLPWWPQVFPVRLLSPKEMKHLQSRPGGPISGLISWRMTCDPQGRTARTVDQISLLQARPWLLQGSVLAHELGHAWILHQGLTGLPQDLEEGFCNFLSHLWLARTRDPHAAHLMAQLEKEQDPIYGDGFRRVKSLAASGGLLALLPQLGPLAGNGHTPAVWGSSLAQRGLP